MAFQTLTDIYQGDQTDMPISALNYTMASQIKYPITVVCQRSLSGLRRLEDEFVQEVSYQLQKVVDGWKYSQNIAYELLESPNILVINSY